MALESNQWILEGVMTSLCPGPSGASLLGRVNIAPMGPIVDAGMQQFVLRPFVTSTTFHNLKVTRQGVFHVVDDVLLLARAAIGKIKATVDVQVEPASQVEGLILTNACRYYELQVVDLCDQQERTAIKARVVAAQTLRDFVGFNRARHAVLEAAILATRVHLTGSEMVLLELERLQVMVDKTGSDREHQAMDLLRDHVRSKV